MVYDAARDRVVLFGGHQLRSNGLPIAGLSDTWEWDGSHWTQRFPVHIPADRYEFAMAYDSRRSRVVVFGGHQQTTNRDLNDTWEWDGSDWLHMNITQSPPTMSGHSMAYDVAHARTVLPDGATTWLWDGSHWTSVNSNNAPAAGASGLAYDANRSRVVLFGGGLDLSDTWEWDGSTWTHRTPSVAPPGRVFHAMAFDSSRGRVVLFGGRFGSSLANVLGDTWTWDGTNWSQETPAASPTARQTQAMAYQESRRRLVLFGGRDASGADLDDTWEYIQPYPASFTPFGAGCPGTAGTPTLAAAGSALPWIGHTFTTRLDNIGSNPFLNVPFLLVGFSRTTWGSQPLPFDLTPFGMVGCSLLAEPALSFTLPNQGGFALWSPMLPNDPGIAGSSLFVQGGVTSFGSNPLGIVLSNGCDVAIGAR